MTEEKLTELASIRSNEEARIAFTRRIGLDHPDFDFLVALFDQLYEMGRHRGKLEEYERLHTAVWSAFHH